MHFRAMPVIRFACAFLLTSCASVRPDLDPNRQPPTHLLREQVQDNPWKSQCNQSLANYPGCIVTGRNTLPTVREDLEWEVAYVRVLFPGNMQLLPHARGYHGAILVMAVGSPEVFLMGYFCYMLNLNVAVPMPTPTGFIWENQGAVSWFPSWIRGPFDYFDSVFPIGTVTGSIINQWLDTIPQWVADHKGYQLTSLWDQPEVEKAQRFTEQSTCHTLCEDAFKTLYKLGGKFTSQFPLCRNYAPFIVSKPQYNVNISDPTVHMQAASWYASMTKCFMGWYFTGATCPESFQEQKYAFGTHDEVHYIEGVLQAPYFGGFKNDMYLEQRMLLPWQNWAVDTKLGECTFPESQTSLTRDMNKMISRGQHGVYTGGFGVIVRNPFDGLTKQYRVTPATLWVNDLFTPSQLFPGIGDPGCPNDGYDGFLKTEACDSGPWDNAQLGVLAGYSMEKLFPNYERMQDADWNYGVFYPYDSNSVDKRCRWLEAYSAYDCPGGWLPWNGPFYPDGTKIGAGGYPAGNPFTDPAGDKGGKGGGAGCHFELTGKAIDQTDAVDPFGRNLVQDSHCQCNVDEYGKDWDKWVDNWILYAKNKPGFDYQGWFKGGNTKAPSWAGDIAMCWMSNPRDMIGLQNALWFRRYDWNNQKLPNTDWQGSKDPTSNRPYWGWNEVPVDKQLMDDPGNWDAIVIKLPAAACGKVLSNDDSVACLNHDAQLRLEKDLRQYLKAGYLVLGADQYGSKPGSSVVFVRETADVNGNFNKEFFCQPWTSPNKLFDIVFISDRGGGPEGTGSCYIQGHADVAFVI